MSHPRLVPFLCTSPLSEGIRDYGWAVAVVGSMSSVVVVVVLVSYWQWCLACLAVPWLRMQILSWVERSVVELG